MTEQQKTPAISLKRRRPRIQWPARRHSPPRILRFRISNFFRSSALRLSVLLLVVSLCGCQSPVRSLFPADGTQWQVQQGQALWRPKRGMPEIGGDVVLASDGAGRHLIQFDKTPMNLLTAQTTTNRWLIKFPQQNLSFSGYGPGSTRFGWLYLPAALEGKSLPRVFHFERKPDGGWRLENARTGETLEGFLSP